MKINIYGKTGEKTTQTLIFDETIWNITPHQQAMYDAIIACRANIRGNYAHTKTRGDVRGGGRKPWKQKGTGRARQGSIRAPQWKGGGVVFGPQKNCNHQLKLNKKILLLAMKSLLSLKVKQKEIMVLKDLEQKSFATKNMIAIFKKLNIIDKKVLVVLEKNDLKIENSIRNIPNKITTTVTKLNPLSLSDNNLLLLTTQSYQLINKRFH